MASEIKVDTISEKTSANGVSIDSVVHKILLSTLHQQMEEHWAVRVMNGLTYSWRTVPSLNSVQTKIRH